MGRDDERRMRFVVVVVDFRKRGTDQDPEMSSLFPHYLSDLYLYFVPLPLMSRCTFTPREDSHFVPWKRVSITRL